MVPIDYLYPARPHDLASIGSIVRGFQQLAIQPRRIPPPRSKTVLSVEHAVDEGRLLSAMHLVVPGDEGRDAVMGKVHMVHFGADPHENHFLFDVEGDVNEGQVALVQKGRRGPFAKSKGASTVMDSSSHVSYRKRQGTMEITVSRGCSASELQLLFSKLSMHRSSVPMTSIILIKGRKRYRLGALEQLDFARLKELITQCLSSYKQCGILLIESKPGGGAMYRPGVHKPRFKNSARRKKGPFAVRS